MFMHIDIDCFFVSAERARNKTLKGLPVAVGGRSNLEIFNSERTNIKLMNNGNSGAFVTPVFHSNSERNFENVFVDEDKKIRGIITTCSYEARARGVKTAMPIAQALQLCPELLVIPSTYKFYHEFSERIRDFLEKSIPSIEQYSIDEFFADLSGWVEDKDIKKFALYIQDELHKQLDIPVSIGISTGKWVAKLATNTAKPYGVFQVDDIDAYIKDIPIAKFPGVGRQYEKRLLAYEIKTLGDIKVNKKLFYSWKKPGIQLYERILGIDNEVIEPRAERKSIGISRTFDNILDANEVIRRIMILARHIVYMVGKIEVNPTTYYLKINYTYNRKAKQSRRVHRVFSESLFKHTLLEMYDEMHLNNASIIKLSLSVSNFSHQIHQAVSLIDLESDMQEAALTKEINRMRDRFGIDIIKTGLEL